MKPETVKSCLMKPKVDYCFKELMEDEIVRNAFISAAAQIPMEHIKKTWILPSHLRKESKTDKLGILDVRVLLDDNTQIDIEIQVTSYAYWAERTLFYLAKMYSEQIHEGEGYDKLQKCIHIGVLDFELFPDEEYASTFHLWEDSRRRMYSDKFEFHTLELPKLAKYQYPETELLNWLRFINGEKSEDFEVAAENNPYIQKAYENLKKISADDVKRLEYESREKAIRDYNHSIHMSRKEGIEEGLKEGIKAMVQLCIELHLTKEEILSQLQQKFSLTEGESELYFAKYRTVQE